MKKYVGEPDPDSGNHKQPRRMAWRWLIIILFTLAASSCNKAYGGTEISGSAPDFRLVDQNSSLISLSDFSGKIVVLTFMDSECRDTCPITAAQFRETYRQLDQNEASQVVFLGVNVSARASEAADALQATTDWHLEEIPTWHFLTGTPDALEAVWLDYGIAVVPATAAHDLLHTPGVFLIDHLRQKRWYISTSFSDSENPGWVPPLSDLLISHIRELLK
jgi:cytochrome oxidase Cu insertion factor (SCO1/SenC/PrrC family)